MSGLTDASQDEGGRRLPFMRKGSPAYALFLFGLFAPPTSLNPFWDTWLVTLWFALLYALYFLANTYCQVPYDALAPELTDAPDSRNSLYYTAGLLDAAGTVAGLLCPALLGATGRSEAKAGCDYHATCLDGVGCKPVVRHYTRARGERAQYNVTYTVDAAEWTAANTAADSSNATAYPSNATELPSGYFVLKWPDAYFNETACLSAPSAASVFRAKDAGLRAPPGVPLPGVDGYCQCRLDCLDQAALGSDGFVLMALGGAMALWYGA
jgi:hypothetical protein